MIPLPGNLVRVWLDRYRRPWYDVTNPVTGEIMRLPNEDVCHYKGPTRDGYTGLSVLSYAADTVQGALAAQEYNARFYESGGQPSGVLTVDTDLGGYVKDPDGKPFQFTPPRRGRPGSSSRLYVIKHFNSRPREGGDQYI